MVPSKATGLGTLYLQISVRSALSYGNWVRGLRTVGVQMASHPEIHLILQKSDVELIVQDLITQNKLSLHAAIQRIQTFAFKIPPTKRA